MVGIIQEEAASHRYLGWVRWIWAAKVIPTEGRVKWAVWRGPHSKYHSQCRFGKLEHIVPSSDIALVKLDFSFLQAFRIGLHSTTALSKALIPNSLSINQEPSSPYVSYDHSSPHKLASIQDAECYHERNFCIICDSVYNFLSCPAVLKYDDLSACVSLIYWECNERDR